jgi:hypothetical protein
MQAVDLLIIVHKTLTINKIRIRNPVNQVLSLLYLLLPDECECKHRSNILIIATSRHFASPTGVVRYASAKDIKFTSIPF